MAIRIIGDLSPDYGPFLTNLGVTYGELHQLGDAEALNRSIAAHTEALARLLPEHGARLTVMSNLGAALMERFEIEHAPEDLHRAQTLLLDVVAQCPPHHPDRGAIFLNASTALFIDQDHLTPQDVWRALALCEEASDALDARSPLAAHLAVVKGQLQHSMAELAGSRAALDLAIDHLELAVRTAATDPRADVSHARIALARALRLRADRYGRLSDLTRAIQQTRSALTETPATAGSARHSRTASLAVALATRFHWTRDIADLQVAIDLLEELVTTDPRRAPQHRANLAVCLAERAATAFAHPEDFDQAAHLLRDLTTTPTEVTRVPALLAALADILLDRADSTGSTDDLEEAHAAASAAVAATSASSPEMVRHLSVLGEVDLSRYQEFARTEDLDSALRNYSDAYGATSAAPSERIRAALLWGHCAAAAGTWSEASRAHDLGRALVPRLLLPDLQLRDGLRLVEDLAEAGPDALAFGLFDGRPDLGLVRSEQWRALILGPDRVRRRLWMRLLGEHPDLGGQLLSVSERLEAWASPIDTVWRGGTYAR